MSRTCKTEWSSPDGWAMQGREDRRKRRNEERELLGRVLRDPEMGEEI